jgi:hypothetical protein
MDVPSGEPAGGGAGSGTGEAGELRAVGQAYGLAASRQLH